MAKQKPFKWWKFIKIFLFIGFWGSFIVGFICGLVYLTNEYPIAAGRAWAGFGILIALLIATGLTYSAMEYEEGDE